MLVSFAVGGFTVNSSFQLNLLFLIEVDTTPKFATLIVTDLLSTL